ncbi:MAG TPA: hypothetical protein VF598_11570 [Hymenobacter sp.]|jgi:hypothetical protein
MEVVPPTINRLATRLGKGIETAARILVAREKPTHTLGQFFAEAHIATEELAPKKRRLHRIGRAVARVSFGLGLAAAAPIAVGGAAVVTAAAEYGVIRAANPQPQPLSAELQRAADIKATLTSGFNKLSDPQATCAQKIAGINLLEQAADHNQTGPQVASIRRSPQQIVHSALPAEPSLSVVRYSIDGYGETRMIRTLEQPSATIFSTKAANPAMSAITVCKVGSDGNPVSVTATSIGLGKLLTRPIVAIS